MSFIPGRPFSRTLWVIFIGERGLWTRPVLPVNDSLGLPDQPPSILLSSHAHGHETTAPTDLDSRTSLQVTN